MSDLERASRFLSKKTEDFWLQKGQSNVLQLIKNVSEDVPAYKDFIQKNGIDIEEIKSLKDIKKLPVVHKKSYQDVYSLEEMVWNGDISSPYMIATSSGSTGKPYYWPKSPKVDERVPDNLAVLLNEFFNIKNKKTLVVVSFALGTWLAGTLMSENCRLVARKENNLLNVVSPGLDLNKNLELVKDLGHKFDQVILMGYPPFIKDIIDEGSSQGIDWKNLNTKIAIGGEGFGEEWRDYVSQKVAKKEDIKVVLSGYALAETGLVGFETPLSIIIRRLASKNSKIRKELFGTQQVPNLFQFNVANFIVEQVDGELIVTSNGSMPLIRYNTGDRGGVMHFSEVIKVVKEQGYDVDSLLEKHGIDNVWKWPFCFVYGRSQMVILYGANIYAEQIKSILEGSELQKTNTGKFKMKVETDENQEQKLVIKVQLSKEAKVDEKINEFYKNTIVEQLKKVNSEYENACKESKERAEPQVELLPFNSDLFNKNDAKLKYIEE